MPAPPPKPWPVSTPSGTDRRRERPAPGRPDREPRQDQRRAGTRRARNAAPSGRCEADNADGSHDGTQRAGRRRGWRTGQGRYIVIRSIDALDPFGRRSVPRVADDPKWTDPGLLVMGSLAEGPKHGYAMVQDVAETTGVAPGPGDPVRGDRPARGPGPHRSRRQRGLAPAALPVDDAGRRGPRAAARRRCSGSPALGRRRLARLSPVPGGRVVRAPGSASSACWWRRTRRASATATATSWRRSSRTATPGGATASTSPSAVAAAWVCTGLRRGPAREQRRAAAGDDHDHGARRVVREPARRGRIRQGGRRSSPVRAARRGPDRLRRRCRRRRGHRRGRASWPASPSG